MGKVYINIHQLKVKGAYNHSVSKVKEYRGQKKKVEENIYTRTFYRQGLKRTDSYFWHNEIPLPVVNRGMAKRAIP